MYVYYIICMFIILYICLLYNIDVYYIIHMFIILYICLLYYIYVYYICLCSSGLPGTAPKGGVAEDVVGVAEEGVAWAEGRALTLVENVTSTDTAAMTNREF